jgi:hypothetical protein
MLRVALCLCVYNANFVCTINGDWIFLYMRACA